MDVSPERTTSIAAAGRNQHDKFHCEIQEHKQGTSWVVERILGMVERADIDASSLTAWAGCVADCAVAGGGGSGGGCVDVGAWACVRAVPGFGAGGGFGAPGVVELRDAVRGAKERPLGDAWAWSRKTSSVDISPLVAATLALGAAAGVTGGEVVIY